MLFTLYLNIGAYKTQKNSLVSLYNGHTRMEAGCMSDDQTKQMLEELIRIVGNTNGIISDLKKHMETFEKRMDARLERIESQLYNLQVVEHRQDKMAARLDTVEAHVEILERGKQ